MFDRLKNWAAARIVSHAIHARVRRDMGKRAWYDGVIGTSGAGFAGGGISRLTQSLAQWSGSANSELDGTLVVMRARARQLCANNEHGRRFLSLVAANVVGHCGPTLQVRAKLSDRKTLDKAANDAVETAWERWTETADLGGRMDLAMLARVAIKAVARDGEALVKIVRDRKLPGGLQLQLLEADRLDEAMNRVLDNGNVVRLGVEIDSAGRAVAYHLKAAHPGERVLSTAPQTERVLARDVLHLFLPERAEQVRGYTWLHAVLVRMNMLHAYEEAAVVAARVGAAKMGVFQKKDEGTPSTLASMADSVDSSGRLQMSAEAGEFMELPPGYELASWDPEYPHANFESFLKACLRGAAAGLDVAAHNLTGDMTDVNYSSARIAELSERDLWQVLQGWWIHAFACPVYEEWLASALLRGEIVLEDSGKSIPPDRFDKFRQAGRFQPRRWGWVDPSKEIEAAEREIAAGLNSRTAIAASQGREVEDIIDELAQEKAMLEKAGLPVQPGQVPGTTPVTAPAAAPAAKEQPVNVSFEASFPEAFKHEVGHVVGVPEMKDVAIAMKQLADAVVESQRQLVQAVEQVQSVGAEVRAASIQNAKPRRIVTDAKGNPIGSVVVDEIKG